MTPSLASRLDRAGGDAARARGQLAALLPVHEWVLDPEHPDTVITRNQVWNGQAAGAC